ncbi:MAG: hypothetical protein JWP92_3645 [Caulobacter sp.]|nr:hypothetical protein [Caulobacter sp.]
MSWNAGYVTDVDYTFGYYNELNPLRARLALIGAGVRPPEVTHACELGFGQGLSAIMHAAANPGVQWWGTDFNPAQAGFAQDMAARAGIDARLFDQAFAEFCARDDLPDFDYIGVHGIWTWISDENRAVIVDFVRRKLKVGGVFYISYNTLPGWSQAAPLRHLIKQHADIMGAPGVGVAGRIDAALEFAEALVAVNPVYSRVSPQVADRLKGMKTHDRRYLAHEYMNRDWRPMYFADMVDWLEPAKVSYVASANFLEGHDAVNMTPEQIALFNAIPNSTLRETVRDYIVMQQFRRDIWVKGPRRLLPHEQADLLRSQRFALIAPRDQVATKVTGLQGEVGLHEHVYGPILDRLADHKPHSLADIEQAVGPAATGLLQLTAALTILTAMSAAAPLQPESVVNAARKTTARLNAVLADRARSSPDIDFLVSPLTGGGIGVQRFEQLFLAARQQTPKSQPKDWGAQLGAGLFKQGQSIVKDGQPLATIEENVAECVIQAEVFAAKRLPIFEALGLV